MANIKLVPLAIVLSFSIIYPSSSSRSTSYTTLDKIKLLEFSMNLCPQLKKTYASKVKKVMLPIKKIFPEFVICPTELSSNNILHWNKMFFVEKSDGSYVQVDNYNVEECLKNISDSKLEKMILNGKLHLTQSSNGKFNIKYHPLLPGGGVLGGKIAYWATKSFCWGVVGAAAIVTAGKAITGAGVLAAKVGVPTITITNSTNIVKTGAGIAINSVGGVGSVPAKVVAVTVANYPAAAEVAIEATAATTAAAGGGIGLVAFIEGLALGASIICGGATGPI